MGNCSSSQLNEEERAAANKSKMIDKDLQNENRNSGNKIKLLLLGAGESGKSTIFKQMKILHGTGFSEDDRMRFKWFIWSNIIECAKIGGKFVITPIHCNVLQSAMRSICLVMLHY